MIFSSRELIFLLIPLAPTLMMVYYIAGSHSHNQSAKYGGEVHLAFLNIHTDEKLGGMKYGNNS